MSTDAKRFYETPMAGPAFEKALALPAENA